ncbi:MAG: hypothetical protein K2J02_01600 [Malacoplasma sp.]|nr:hypothetical protein [Malacoplasma sp.]
MNTKELQTIIKTSVNIQCLFFCIQSKRYQTRKRVSNTPNKIISLKRIFN